MLFGVTVTCATHCFWFFAGVLNGNFFCFFRSSVTAVYFVVKQLYQNFIKYLGPDVYPEWALQAADVMSAGVQLLEDSVLTMQGYERYINIWGLLLKQKPPSFQNNLLLANVTAALKVTLSGAGKPSHIEFQYSGI
jgi:hypothetical protein